ncbi:MAG: glycosyltransferase family 9 protein [Leptospirales bacterium]
MSASISCGIGSRACTEVPPRGFPEVVMETLVIQRARLGDLIQTLPLLQRLKLQGGRVTLLVSEDLADAARLLFPSGEVLGFPGNGGVSRGLNTSLMAGVPLLREVWSNLADRSWDQVIQLNHDGTGVLLGQLVRSGERRGFVSLQDRRVAGVEELPLEGWPAYLVSSARSVRAINRIHLSDIWKGFAEGTSTMGEGDRPWSVRRESSPGPVGIVLSGRSRYRQLTFEALSRLVEGIQRSSDRPLVLLGRPDERELSMALARMASGKVVNRVGETSLSELAEQIERLSLLVSPDTASLHIAALKGVPSLGLFFANAQPHETGAYCAGAFSLTPEMECYPCAGEGSDCSHLSCRSLLPAEYLVALSLSILEGRLLPAPPEHLRLWIGKHRFGRFLNSPVHPVKAVREDLLGILYRRFFLRILDHRSGLPTLESEWEGYRGGNTLGGCMQSLAAGADHLSRLPAVESKERIRLSGEFPLLWPILHHTEQVECGRGDRHLQSEAFSMLAAEAASIATLHSGTRHGSAMKDDRSADSGRMKPEGNIMGLEACR